MVSILEEGCRMDQLKNCGNKKATKRMVFISESDAGNKKNPVSTCVSCDFLRFKF